MSKKWKMILLAGLTALAAVAGIVKLGPSHTVATRAAVVTERAAEVLEPMVRAIPEAEELDGGTR